MSSTESVDFCPLAFIFSERNFLLGLGTVSFIAQTHAVLQQLKYQNLLKSEDGISPGLILIPKPCLGNK